MIYDLQKASIWKRISAAIFDFILLSILALGFALLLSLILGYDGRTERLESYYDKYEEQYGIEFDITEDEYNQLGAEKQTYDDAYAALIADDEAMLSYQMVMNITLLITSLGIFLAYLVIDFVVPLVFGNGQTLGKKIFSIAVMHTNGVRITPIALFCRTVLGKYAIETMVPVLICVMIYFNSIGITGLVVLGLLVILQAILLHATHTNSLIHDLISTTVVVDMASQMIFSSQEEMIEFKKQAALEKAERQQY